MMINKNSYWYDSLILFIAIGLFFCIGLDARPYITPSEARYIEIPRQMLATGDFLTPHINGVQYFEKPPLFYWLQAFFLSFGDNEFFGRIATTLVVTLTCLVTYATGRLIYGRTAGLLAAGALATSVMGYGLSRVAMLDAPVTLFLTCTIASFIAAQKTGQKKFYYFMYVAAALAVMTKGLIGIVIPAMVIGCWIMFTKNWKILKEARLFTGTLLFLAIAAPWHILMAIKHPEFADFYFIHEHFTRFLSDEHKRTAPWWLFIAVTLAGAMPWILLLTPLLYWRYIISLLSLFSGYWYSNEYRASNDAASSKKQATDWDSFCANILDKNFTLFLNLWIFLPLIFFSFSNSKLIPYIFPIFSPIFIFIGKHLADWWEMPIAPKQLKINTTVIFTLTWGCCFLALIAAKSFTILLYGFVPALLVAIILFVKPITNKTSAKHLIKLIIVFGATLGLTANYIASDFDKRTIKSLVEPLNKKLKADDMVVAYNSYWQDLPVYLNRNVTIAGWTGELSFGTQHTPNAKDWMISLDEFWTKCAESKNNVYVFMNEEDHQNIKPHTGCELHEMSRYGKTILLKKDLTK
jgi:4-amino-4-deoxy-L-arabinose transferase-like glycosyltransferase